MRNLYLSISRGEHVRQWLQAGLVDELLTMPDARVILLTLAHADSTFCDRYHDGRVLVRPLPVNVDSGSHLHKVRQWAPFTPPGFQRMLRRRLPHRLRQRRWVSWCADWLGRAAQWRRRIQMAALAAERQFEGLLADYPPILVVVFGPLDVAHFALLVETHAAGIRNLAVVDSWDPVEAGVAFEFVDRLAVWTEAQLQAVQDWPPRFMPQAVRVGSPLIDEYQRVQPYLTRTAFCADLGLDPARPLIVFCTSGRMPSSAWGGQDYIMQDLLAARREHTQLAEAQFVICPHPDNHLGAYMKYMQNEDVRFEQDVTWVNALGWAYSPAQAARRLNLLRHADLVVAPPGEQELLVETALVDTPLVIAGYNRVEPEEIDRAYAQRASRPPFNRLPAARSEAELARLILESLTAPARYQTLRRQLVHEIFAVDEHTGAITRLASEIRSLCAAVSV